MIEKGDILEFVKRHDLMVVATADKTGKPEAAVVEFGETEKLELILDTFTSSRKYRNIQSNPRVACVIGWDEDKTVQYEGEAFELAGLELENCKELYFAKNERARKWEGREGVTYLKIVPRWIRYSDLNSDPWTVFEMEL